MIADKKNRRPCGRRLVSRGKGRPVYGARDSTVEICKKIVPRTADMPVPPNTPNMPTAIVTTSTTPRLSLPPVIASWSHRPKRALLPP